MNNKIKNIVKTLTLLVVSASFLATNLSAQTTVTISQPSDDRWHYPFNFTNGFRDSAPLFAADSFPFNDRDGMMYMRFDTSADVSTGTFYDFDSVIVEAWVTSGTFFDFETVGNDINSTSILGIWGMGNNDFATGTSFTLQTWNETSPFIGGTFNPGPSFSPRFPYPLNLDPLGNPNVGDDLAAETWGHGEPDYGTGTAQYDIGTTTTEPFPIYFELNVCNPTVRQYIKDGLSEGALRWVLSTNIFSPGNPNILTKEGSLSLVGTDQYAPKLIIGGLEEVAAEPDILISEPAEDRWQYPFNFTNGFRDSAPLFTAGFPFNYRDGVMLVEFDTPFAGISQDVVDVESVKIIAYNTSGSFTFTTTEFDGASTGILEVFGVGNDDFATSADFSRSSWVESSPYYGSGFSPFVLRNPFALNIDEFGPEYVHDTVSAVPWAEGSVTIGSANGEYQPGVDNGVPFAITYDVDLSNARVKQYVLDELNRGQLLWMLSANISSPGNPNILTKEGSVSLVGTNQYAPKLLIEGVVVSDTPLSTRVDGWSLYE